MVNYQCQRCGYQTINKSYFKKHLLRKNLCEPKVEEITRYILLLQNGFDEEAKNHKIINNNLPQYQHMNNKNHPNVCRFCNKILSFSVTSNRFFA